MEESHADRIQSRPDGWQGFYRPAVAPMKPISSQANRRMRPQESRRLIGSEVNHPRTGSLWHLTVESWLLCQVLIAIRQNLKSKVATRFPQSWWHD